MPKKGQKMSEEAKQKIRLARIGVPRSESTKQKLRLFRTGRRASEETLKKMSVISTGKRHRLESRKKMSENLKGNRRRLGIRHSMETRRKMSEAQKGDKNHLWKGGITPINRAIRRSLEYRLWRDAVFKRDNYTCIWCGARSGNGVAVRLEADHIKSFALYPELRFAIDNGRTLCHDCHETTPNYGGKSHSICH